MATYKSKPVRINAPVAEVFDKVSDFSKYQNRLEELPEDIRAKIGQVRFTPDSIVITAAPVGEMAFEVVERTAPSRVRLSAANSPVAMELRLDLTDAGADTTDVVSCIEVDIPAVLRPMVGGKMQEAADKFGELIATFFNRKDS